MSATAPKCGDGCLPGAGRLMNAGLAASAARLAVVPGCTRTLHAIHYKRYPNNEPGVCLVCPVCDSPAEDPASKNPT
ncbi:MAG: hypothetical protein ACXVHB_06010 [Solirubrobacteraceae bacterium]